MTDDPKSKASGSGGEWATPPGIAEAAAWYSAMLPTKGGRVVVASTRFKPEDLAELREIFTAGERFVMTTDECEIETDRDEAAVIDTTIASPIEYLPDGTCRSSGRYVCGCLRIEDAIVIAALLNREVKP